MIESKVVREHISKIFSHLDKGNLVLVDICFFMDDLGVILII